MAIPVRTTLLGWFFLYKKIKGHDLTQIRWCELLIKKTTIYYITIDDPEFTTE